MKLLFVIRFVFIAALIPLIFSCNEKEEFATEKISDYMPLIPGKYITYRLDSMVFTNYNKNIEIHKYQVKYLVDAQVTDNLGRPSYRVFRFIRDSINAQSWTPAQPWAGSGSFFITPLSDQLELIEDNLRIIKWHMPLTGNFTWKGNKYLSPDPYYTNYSLRSSDFLNDWDFYYDGIPSTFSYRGATYSNVYTIEEADEATNVPVTIPTAYGNRMRAVEKYSKGIGLVYRQYDVWEYQPDPNQGGPNNVYYGFGVTQWMIDHN